ncbi:hypothetical protein KO566_12805 [Flavobacteriaceae bacterium XHP0103]|uniref:hypothetical protein n=1 Tax=Marixanthotalea marina TaxID=2844359 RepID=UPI002989B393|nr:hypothetical protein [Marixanthotalea marina]MBU3822944.1 hypothetical protein [Marixanthotalea marina]
MKTFIAYFFFALLAIRPAYNVGYMAYFELNIDYIIETYCINKDKPMLNCDGKCFLAKQLNMQQTDENKETKPYLASFSEAFFPVFFQEYNYSPLIGNFITGNNNNWAYGNSFYSLWTARIEHPPQLA